MCYVHNQCYDISCATLYIYIYIYIYIHYFLIYLTSKDAVADSRDRAV